MPIIDVKTVIQFVFGVVAAVAIAVAVIATVSTFAPLNEPSPRPPVTVTVVP